MGQVCDRQKRFAEAQENYQRAIRLAEDREPDLFNDLGYSFFLQGKLDKAESAIRKAVALRPTEPKYHNNLGLIYGHQRRFEDAWNEFRLAGGEADACYNLAFIKASLNDFAGAKACFRRALAIDPSHDQARRALRAFELAETDPDSLAQMETSNDDGTKWVPYVEDGQDQDTSAGSRGTASDRNAADTAPNSSITSRNTHRPRRLRIWSDTTWQDGLPSPFISFAENCPLFCRPLPANRRSNPLHGVSCAALIAEFFLTIF